MVMISLTGSCGWGAENWGSMEGGAVDGESAEVLDGVVLSCIFDCSGRCMRRLKLRVGGFVLEDGIGNGWRAMGRYGIHLGII